MANEELMHILDACGWWDEMPEAERARMQTKLRDDQGDDSYLNLAVVAFDTECIESFWGENPSDLNSYHKIILYYARHSWGLFTPTHILDEYDSEKNQVRVGFDFSSERFEVTVPYAGDWFDAEVHNLINPSLEQNGIPLRFLPLPASDQVLYCAFISPSTLRKAVEMKAFPILEQLLAEQ